MEITWEFITTAAFYFIIALPPISAICLKYSKRKSFQFRYKLQSLLFFLSIVMTLVFFMNEAGMFIRGITFRFDLIFTIFCLLIQWTMVSNSYSDLLDEKKLNEIRRGA